MAFIRGKGKNNADIKLIDLYKSYKKHVKDPVDYKTYSDFLKQYNEKIMSAIIYESFEFKMPFKLGYIRVQKLKYTPYMKNGELRKNHLHVDWKSTLEKWRKDYPGLTDEEIKKIPNKKRLLYLNEHSNGYSVRFLWDKRISNVKNQSCYRFQPTRTAKEFLAKFIKKTGVIDYFA